MTSSSPSRSEGILDGARILDRGLAPKSSQFHFPSHGRNAGGDFARDEFVHESCVLEVHFPGERGLVRYHVSDQSASRESYLREVCAYENNANIPNFLTIPRMHSMTWRTIYVSPRISSQEIAEMLAKRDKVVCRNVWCRTNGCAEQENASSVGFVLRRFVEI